MTTHTIKMSDIVKTWPDSQVFATVEHFEEIERTLGSLKDLTQKEKTVFDAAFNEFTDRELR